ncbi:uncharacterized protein IL334_000753 [Kwoniella shivajii]|uniref:Uncharacterized protein n=1 Tax=Kwoniella shivajii TaxID=564305 RepID=A0ABZ1CQ66_9TREE|nr:hypothetical protein IL334_000753 [Kwoniella shivajii]
MADNHTNPDLLRSEEDIRSHDGHETGNEETDHTRTEAQSDAGHSSGVVFSVTSAVSTAGAAVRSGLNHMTGGGVDRLHHTLDPTDPMRRKIVAGTGHAVTLIAVGGVAASTAVAALGSSFVSDGSFSPSNLSQDQRGITSSDIGTFSRPFLDGN